MALIFAGSVSATNTTTDDEIWYNTPAGDGPGALYAYNTTSNSTRLVTNLDKTYGDIAWGSDGNLYGVSFDDEVNTIELINTSNGQGTVLKNIAGFFNSMASDNLGWLYIGGNSNFVRYNIYSGVLEEWINVADYGINGSSTGDSVFVNEDFYATFTYIDNFLIKITGLDANHAVTAGTSISVVINDLPSDSYALARGNNNDLYLSGWAGQEFALFRISLEDNSISQVADTNGGPYGGASKIFNETINPENTTVNAVGMQETGTPLALLVLAILAVFGGFLGTKRE